MIVRIQEQDFDVGAELTAWRGTRRDIGAIATFIGLVRDLNDDESVSTLTLEHYPGMTEKALTDICEQARQRFDIVDVLVIHRVGRLGPGDRIVFVATAGAHRGQAFAACEFVMDFLKTRAPFWKKEGTPHGERWVDARASDDEAARRWAGPHSSTP